MVKNKKSKSKSVKVHAGRVTYTSNNDTLKGLLLGVNKYTRLMDRVLNLHKRYQPIELRLRSAHEAPPDLAAYMNTTVKDVIYINPRNKNICQSALLASYLVHETAHWFDSHIECLKQTVRVMIASPEEQEQSGLRGLLEEAPYFAKSEYIGHALQLVFLEKIMEQESVNTSFIDKVSNVYWCLITIQDYIDSSQVFLNVVGKGSKYIYRQPLTVQGRPYGFWSYGMVADNYLESKEAERARKSVDETLNRLRSALMS